MDTPGAPGAPNDRWSKPGPRTDALALAGALAAVVRAAGAMVFAGDLTPTGAESTFTQELERKVALIAAVARVRELQLRSLPHPTTDEEESQP